MMIKQLPLTLCFIIHTFWGNANASLSSESEEENNIELSISHTQHPRMRGLGYIQLCLFDGTICQQTFPEMNVHSPPTSPRNDSYRPPIKSPRGGTYRPNSSSRRTYTKNYNIPVASFENQDTLTATFFTEEVRAESIFDENTGKQTIQVNYMPWQGLENIPIVNLGSYSLEEEDGLTLHSLEIDIIWKNMSKPTSDITPIYE